MAIETALLHHQYFDEDKTLPNIEAITGTKCLRCGRALTNPISVARGIGPKCAQTIAYETRRKQETPSYTFTPRTEFYFSRKDQLAQQNPSFQALIYPYQTLIEYIGGIKPIESNKNRFHWPDMSVIADHLIPACCCCERVLIQGQLAEFVSKKLDREVYFCKDCHTKACDPRTNHCNLEHMTRPSPLTEFMSLISS